MILLNAVREATGSEYAELLTWAQETASVMGLVVDGDRSAERLKQDAFVQRMRPSLIGWEYVKLWPGTISRSEVRRYAYRFDSALVTTVLEATSSLYQWLGPAFMENLQLLREDQSVLLGSNGQEEDSWLTLSEDEFRAWQTCSAELQATFSQHLEASP